jgi:hypothetical protein
VSKLFIIPGQLVTFASLKDRSLKLTFETGEPTPEQMVGLQYSLQTFGWIAFKPDEFKEKEREMLDGLKSDFDDKTKSKAQRLRAVIFKYWEQGHQGYEEFNYFYDHLMEKIITHYKDKLDG